MNCSIFARAGPRTAFYLKAFAERKIMKYDFFKPRGKCNYLVSDTPEG